MRGEWQQLEAVRIYRVRNACQVWCVGRAVDPGPPGMAMLWATTFRRVLPATTSSTLPAVSAAGHPRIHHHFPPGYGSAQVVLPDYGGGDRVVRRAADWSASLLGEVDGDGDPMPVNDCPNGVPA
jgi:hypothetical protein